ncbi:Ferric reductase transmembrane component 4 [Colletotrichum viniferum]|nr:Ferric reductase transmembrane component 4 [Colletotrichum viniferum]
MFPSSVIPIRRKIYETFLAWHIAVAILIIAGCYWHVVFEFKRQWGYEVWIIVCMAIWTFDRVFRVLRLLRHGVKTADITTVDSD